MKTRTKAEAVLAYLRQNGLPDGFCPVPFFSVIFEANGKACLCRQKGNEFATGNMRQESLQEVWNGRTLQDIRTEFLTGNIRTCATEIARDHCNLSGEHLEYLPLIELSPLQSKGPLRITPNFNGHCNLRCPMCHVWKFEDGLYDQIGFWETVENDILPTLREIDHFSGEPFVQKDTYRLMDLVLRVNPSIIWNFTTNGNWRFNEKIRSYLDRIVIRNFVFSFDSLDRETYKAIRKGGDLDRALETFHQVRAFNDERVAGGRPPMQIQINFTFQILNRNEVPGFLRYFRNLGHSVSFRCLTEPLEFSVNRLSEAEKVDTLQRLIDQTSAEDLPYATRVVKYLLEDVGKLAKSELLLRYQEKLSSQTAEQQLSGA